MNSKENGPIEADESAVPVLADTKLSTLRLSAQSGAQQTSVAAVEDATRNPERSESGESASTADPSDELTHDEGHTVTQSSVNRTSDADSEEGHRKPDSNVRKSDLGKSYWVRNKKRNSIEAGSKASRGSLQSSYQPKESPSSYRPEAGEQDERRHRRAARARTRPGRPTVAVQTLLHQVFDRGRFGSSQRWSWSGSRRK